MNKLIFFIVLIFITIVNLPNSNGSTYPAVANVTISLVNITATTMCLSYSSIGGIPGATTYNVQVGNTSPCVGTSETTCLATGLNPDQMMAIRVTAFNDGNNATMGQVFTTNKTIIVNSLDPSQQFLSTAKTFGVNLWTYYRIDQVSSFSFTLNDTLTSECQSTSTTPCFIRQSSYIDNLCIFVLYNLNPGTYYNVTGIVSAEGYSSSKSRILSTIPSVKITSINVEGSWPDSLFIRMAAVPSWDTRFFVSVNGTNEEYCYNTTSNSCRIQDLTKSTYYSVSVRATNEGLEDTMTKIFRTAPKSGIYISSFSSIIKTKSITLYYTAAGEDSVEFKITFNNSNVNRCSGNTSQCIITGLSPNTEYPIKLYVQTRGGASSDQRDITVKTYQTVSDPSVTVTKKTNSTLLIEYTTQNGIPSESTYDVTVNNTIVCSKISLNQCEFYPYELNQYYNIKVIVYNDDTVKSSTKIFKTGDNASTTGETTSTSTTSSASSSTTEANTSGINSSSRLTTISNFVLLIVLLQTLILNW